LRPLTHSSLQYRKDASRLCEVSVNIHSTRWRT